MPMGTLYTCIVLCVILRSNCTHPMDNVTIIVINLVLILTGFFFNFNHENYVAHPATTDIISLRGISCRAYIIYTFKFREGGSLKHIM